MVTLITRGQNIICNKTHLDGRYYARTDHYFRQLFAGHVVKVIFKRVAHNSLSTTDDPVALSKVVCSRSMKRNKKLHRMIINN